MFKRLILLISRLEDASIVVAVMHTNKVVDLNQLSFTSLAHTYNLRCWKYVEGGPQWHYHHTLTYVLYHTLIIFHIISTCCRPPSSHHINDHAFLEDLTKDSVFDHLTMFIILISFLFYDHAFLEDLTKDSVFNHLNHV